MPEIYENVLRKVEKGNEGKKERGRQRMNKDCES